MNPLIAFVSTFLISYVLTIPAIRLAKKFDLVTDKKTRLHPAHTHKGIIPRAGGVPIFLAFLLGCFFFIQINKIILGILISSFFLIIIGLFDDYYDTSPYLRFLGNLFISMMVVGFGLGIPFISNPFGGAIRLDQWIWTIDFFGERNILIAGDILAIIWLTWTTNMVNWSKGVDGQLPGFTGIAAIFLGLLAQRFVVHDVSTQNVMMLSFVIAGAFLGFLPFNFYPQKIMPGYGGGALAGFWLGILSILSFGKIGTAILILAIPMMDAIYSIARRIKNRQSPFRADWGHFHHRLLEIGWGRRRIAAFYWIITAVLGVASLFLEGVEKFIAFLTIGLILVVFIIITNQIKANHFNRV